MQQTNSKDKQHVLVQAETRPASQIQSETKPDVMTYEQLKQHVFEFFSNKDYECFESFKRGNSRPVNEDFRNIDLLCNLNDLVYNYCSNKNMSPEQKANFKNLCTGIQMLTTSMKQYDTNDTDQVFVAHLTGYILKVIRNFYHD